MNSAMKPKFQEIERPPRVSYGDFSEFQLETLVSVLLELNRDEVVAIFGRSSAKKDEELIGERRSLGLRKEEVNPRRA